MWSYNTILIIMVWGFHFTNKEKLKHCIGTSGQTPYSALLWSEGSGPLQFPGWMDPFSDLSREVWLVEVGTLTGLTSTPLSLRGLWPSCLTELPVLDIIIGSHSSPHPSVWSDVLGRIMGWSKRPPVQNDVIHPESSSFSQPSPDLCQCVSLFAWSL